MLEEFQHLLAPLGFRPQIRRLEPNFTPSLGSLTLPRAQMYVTDAHAPHQAIEVLVGAIQKRFPVARQLVVAERFTEANAFPLLRLGVKGLLSYEEAREKLPEALDVVAAGGFWVPRNLLSRFVDSILRVVQGRRVMQGPTNLSQREREVLDALLENRANKEIADRLHISERTVKFHVSSLLAKFAVRRRTDLILLWFQNRSTGL